MSTQRSPSKANNIGWWHTHYIKHPGKAAKSNDAYTSGQYCPTKSKQTTKVYCGFCFDNHVQELGQERIRGSVPSGQPAVVPRADLERELWSTKAPSSAISRGWRSSHPSTMLKPLAQCPFLTGDAVQTRARGDPSCTLSSRVRGSHHSSHPGQLGQPTGYQSEGMRASPISTQFTPEHSTCPSPLNLSLDASLPSASFYPSAPTTPLVPSFYQSSPSALREEPPSLLLRGSPLSRSSSIQEGSVLGSPAIGGMRSISIPSNSQRMRRHFTQERQQLFEARLARLTASANLPLSWVDNPEWLLFLLEFVADAKHFSRKALTNRIIPSLVKSVRSRNKATAKGKSGTIQADGWTGENFRHFVGFMVTVEGEVFTVHVHDASNERKTTEKLLEVLKKVYHELQNEWGVTVVAVTTDASGESRKARRLFVREFPSVVVLDCFAHQINLVVGDYFKADSDLSKYGNMATELITWLRSKTLLLSRLKEETRRQLGKFLSVLRAVLTRWTAHYRAFERLLLLSHCLRSLVENDAIRDQQDRCVIVGDSAAKRKARKMVATIKDDLFWHSLTQIKMHLEPLAYAANVIQAAFCRLDTVLLTFGWLVAKYKGMTDPQDQPGCAAIISSLERRWSKTDQEVFIVAVLLHPLFRTKPFKTGSITTNAAVSSLFLRVYHRLYQTAAPFDFIQYMDDYLEKKGVFDNLDEQVTKTEMLAAHKGQLFDPLDLFKKYCHPDRPDPPFIGFAKRIFSITANSASCERLFSAFGVILTKRRNKLLPRTMTNINELAMHVHDEHLRMKHSVMARGQKSAAVVENIRSRWLSLQQIVEASSMPPPSQPNPSPSLPVPSTTIADAMAFGLTQPSDSTMSFNQPYSGPDSDLESDASDSESEDELTSADLRSMTAAADGIDAARNPDATFSDLVQAQGSLASEDDTDNDPLLPRAAANSTPSAPHRHLHLIPLSDLFDFNNPWWVDRFKTHRVFDHVF